MKIKSLRYRINLWYTVLMCIIAAAFITCVVTAARMVEKNEAQQTLIKSVERNVDEIEVENGVLDIESDFAFLNGDVHALVFSAEGNLLGGSYPDNFTNPPEMENGKINIIGDYYVYDSLLHFLKFEYKINGITGEIISSECDALVSYTPFSGNLDTVGENCVLSYRQAYDIALEHSTRTKESTELIMARSYEYNEDPLYEIEFYCSEAGYEDIWVRGVMKSDYTGSVWGIIAQIAAILVPIVIIISSLVGNIIAKKSMLPIKKLSEAVSFIQSGSDLSKKVDVVDSDPDIVSLTNNFNAMSERLHISFETEKQFSSDVSHELKTPTSVIIAECDYQLSSAEEPYKESFKTIKKQAEGISNIISQMLLFSRLEQGNEKPHMENEDLSELVNAVCDNIEFVMDKNITLERDIDSDIFMKLDISMMTRIVTNLVSNAATYQDDNGYIKVSLKKNDEGILLTVQDKGYGISKEHLDKIWNRFYRVDKSRSRMSGGSGLGLSMVKQLTEIHGGKVSVESEIGKGSTFYVQLPQE